MIYKCSECFCLTKLNENPIYSIYTNQPPVLAHRMDEGASSLIVMLINWMAATVFGGSRKSEREHYINNKEYVANVPPLATRGFKAFRQTKTCYLFLSRQSSSKSAPTIIVCCEAFVLLLFSESRFTGIITP